MCTLVRVEGKHEYKSYGGKQEKKLLKSVHLALIQDFNGMMNCSPDNFYVLFCLIQKY